MCPSEYTILSPKPIASAAGFVHAKALFVGPILRFLSFHEAVGFVNVKTLLLLDLYTRILLGAP